MANESQLRHGIKEIIKQDVPPNVRLNLIGDMVDETEDIPVYWEFAQLFGSTSVFSIPMARRDYDRIINRVKFPDDTKLFVIHFYLEGYSTNKEHYVLTEEQFRDIEYQFLHGDRLFEKHLVYFWAEKLFWYNCNDLTLAGRPVIRFNGEHYVAGDEESDLRGHGGSKFEYVLNHDDIKYTTNNLQHQGSIPKEIRYFLPDNVSCLNSVIE